MTYLERAKRLAQECHAGQVDKAGYDYIDHVERVADAVKGDVMRKLLHGCTTYLKMVQRNLQHKYLVSIIKL